MMGTAQGFSRKRGGQEWPPHFHLVSIRLRSGHSFGSRSHVLLATGDDKEAARTHPPAWRSHEAERAGQGERRDLAAPRRVTGQLSRHRRLMW